MEPQSRARRITQLEYLLLSHVGQVLWSSKANFHEKAHFVKGRRGGLVAVETNGFCPSRYASIRTVSEPTLFGGSVHHEIRLFGLI
jgi:hypothetical protein